MSGIQEFKEFAVKGNVVDMAVGVIMAFAIFMAVRGIDKLKRQAPLGKRPAPNA